MKFYCFIFVCALFSPLVRAEDKFDLTYDTAAGDEVKLDLSVPDGPGPFPVCILIHGGGFERGDKQEQVKPLFAPLADAGFAWVSTNYRLAPAQKHPASHSVNLSAWGARPDKTKKVTFARREKK